MSELRLENVGYRYGAREVLRALSYPLAAGEQVALLGPNGAGKSTLLRLCAGLRPGHSGSVQLQGRSLADAAEVAARVAFVAQEAPPLGDLRAGELVLTGLAPLAGSWATGGESGSARARAAMQTTGTLELALRPLATLSGGELRRVLLDLGAQGRVLELLALAAARGAAVLCALHDVNLARRFFPRALLLSGGALVADGPSAEVLSFDRIEAAFGAADREGQFFFPRRGEVSA